MLGGKQIILSYIYQHASYDPEGDDHTGGPRTTEMFQPNGDLIKREVPDIGQELDLQSDN